MSGPGILSQPKGQRVIDPEISLSWHWNSIITQCTWKQWCVIEDIQAYLVNIDDIIEDDGSHVKKKRLIISMMLYEYDSFI